MPVSLGSCESNFGKASYPPAEAPMPTMEKLAAGALCRPPSSSAAGLGFCAALAVEGRGPALVLTGELGLGFDLEIGLLGMMF